MTVDDVGVWLDSNEWLGACKVVLQLAFDQNWLLVSSVSSSVDAAFVKFV